MPNVDQLIRDFVTLKVNRVGCLYLVTFQRCRHLSNTRLTLPNDFLFKVDIASMKESLEFRVSILDEKLFAFRYSLPDRVKVSEWTCKIGS